MEKEIFDALHKLKADAAEKLGADHPFNGKFAACFDALEAQVKPKA